MKAIRWILMIGFIVVLGFFAVYSLSGLSPTNIKSNTPIIGMGDFRRIEYQSAIPVTGGSESRVGMGDLRAIENLPELPVTGGPTSALRVRMADLRVFEFRQNVQMGFGDLRRLEANQIGMSTVGVGDLHRFEAGQ